MLQLTKSVEYSELFSYKQYEKTVKAAEHFISAITATCVGVRGCLPTRLKKVALALPQEKPCTLHPMTYS